MMKLRKLLAALCMAAMLISVCVFPVHASDPPEALLNVPYTLNTAAAEPQTGEQLLLNVMLFTPPEDGYYNFDLQCTNPITAPKARVDEFEGPHTTLTTPWANANVNAGYLYGGKPYRISVTYYGDPGTMTLTVEKSVLILKYKQVNLYYCGEALLRDVIVKCTYPSLLVREYRNGKERIVPLLDGEAMGQRTDVYFKATISGKAEFRFWQHGFDGASPKNAVETFRFYSPDSQEIGSFVMGVRFTPMQWLHHYVLFGWLFPIVSMRKYAHAAGPAKHIVNTPLRTYRRGGSMCPSVLT